ncbi:MAG: hypothetical protein COY66_03500 [Candidatus Kerfeldbacteria bacterium CG_4_10_14_0_8_um_filter_42_10]|uniref:Phospholipid/glycerol acyltransferase domain-containing protein n=1 Tax=Candidatus Kerfeldbacteria bacterium CG_4_10_14_0_8_um_filter_42_10 TaxID=2014248 RepID=A0A2M7RIU6_9BACT|nr:MAG: hypothetical protein COY66_03500 [Candidatus Kerfeldbacteria bacterium CG_4_10_14_0_8_um_filter_42_10]
MTLPKRNGVVTYVLNLLVGTLGWFFFWVLNRTTVIGVNNINPNCIYLFVSNHRSLIDSFLETIAFCFPRILFHPSIAPYHTPDAQNYLKAKIFAGRSKFLAKLLTPLTTFLFIHLKCLPVSNGRKDLHALNMVKSILSRSSVHVFPEGTRSITGELGKPRDGIGKVIYDVQPEILPVFVDGIDRVLPRGAKFPRLGKRITVVFGEPFNCQEFKSQPDTRETWQVIAQHIMGKIAQLAPKTQT